MGSLSEARILGGIGSILVILAAIPIFLLGTILSLAGFVLILIAVKFISDELRDRSIFTNMLIAAVLTILGVILAGILLIAALAQLPFLEGFLQPLIPLPRFTESAVLNLIIGLLLALVTVWAAYTASAVFLRRSFASIASGLKVEMFNTAALIYLIGSLLVGVFFFGFLLIIVAQILQVLAFFSLPETVPGAG